MSKAMSEPPATAPNITPWIMLAGRRKSKNESTGGNPGSAVARLKAEAFTAARSRGKRIAGNQMAG